jgi:hypothetical protein
MSVVGGMDMDLVDVVADWRFLVIYCFIVSCSYMTEWMYIRSRLLYTSSFGGLVIVYPRRALGHHRFRQPPVVS